MSPNRQNPGDHPKPDEIRSARESAGLSQSAAAELIYSTLRTWQDWEAGIARMHPGLWELFRIKTTADTVFFHATGG